MRTLYWLALTIIMLLLACSRKPTTSSSVDSTHAAKPDTLVLRTTSTKPSIDTAAFSFHGFAFRHLASSKRGELLWGSEEPTVFQDGKSFFYCYTNYAVLQFPIPQDRDSLIIYRRTANTGDINLTKPLGDTVFTTSFEFGVWFFGLQAGYLFFDFGTGPDGGRITVTDLTTRKQILDASYDDPLVLRGNDSLVFYQVTDKEPTQENCPNLEKWKAEGLGAAIEERVIFSLSKLTKTRTGEFRCESRQ